jgi:hypothetical protein
MYNFMCLYVCIYIYVFMYTCIFICLCIELNMKTEYKCFFPYLVKNNIYSSMINIDINIPVPQLFMTLIIEYLVFVLLYLLYILSHEYIFLIEFILYLCCSGWFHISIEVDFVTHCHVVIFI